MQVPLFKQDLALVVSVSPSSTSIIIIVLSRLAAVVTVVIAVGSSYTSKPHQRFPRWVLCGQCLSCRCLLVRRIVRVATWRMRIS